MRDRCVHYQKCQKGNDSRSVGFIVRNNSHITSNSSIQKGKERICFSGESVHA
ncbi:MAG: hypothetical protein A4E38_01837 [Methanoregulaceae archaeon PtaB.Bin108]|nr:MAG: hypothetical protein A4E38_01837 [Methanoregulaceae archaeon PtaB.Bin108]